MHIEWNKVTWYSKTLAVIVLLSTIYLGVWFKNEFDKIRVSNGSTAQQTEKPLFSYVDGKYCFTRTQLATKAEPFSAEEHIAIDIKGGAVSGTKAGTQAGPGVSNGFYGTLAGTKKSSELELIYSYTVEGSQGKELELYKLENENLVKSIFVLTEKSGVLTPDQTQPVRSIAYTKENCTE